MFTDKPAQGEVTNQDNSEKPSEETLKNYNEQTIYLFGKKNLKKFPEAEAKEFPAADSLTSKNLEQFPRPNLKLIQENNVEKVRKPEVNEWILGRHPEKKLNLISWLIDGCLIHQLSSSTSVNPALALIKGCKKEFPHTKPPEFQSFDGFFNNVFKVDLGAVGKLVLA